MRGFKNYLGIFLAIVAFFCFVAAISESSYEILLESIGLAFASFLLLRKNKKERLSEDEVVGRCKELEAETSKKCKLLEAETSEKCRQFEEETARKCKRLEEEAAKKCNKTEEEVAGRCKELETETSKKCELLEEETARKCKLLEEEAAKKCNKTEDAKNRKCEVLENQIKTRQSELKELKIQLQQILDETFDATIFPYSFDDKISSEEYKNQLSLLRTKIMQLIKYERYYDYNLESPSEQSSTKKARKNNIQQMLRCFNAESQLIMDNVTVKNIDTCRNKLQKSFDAMNRIFETDGISLSNEFLRLKLEELHVIYSYKLRKEQEQEEQKAIREQMLEEEKVRREIEREKAKIEKEENQFKNEVSKLMKYLQKASDIEKQLYIDKINELEEKLKGLEKDKDNVLQREQNTRAGFVYVISNIGSFGEDVYKIGMTRRLEPMERIRELGSASVPFEFDVHAMIFSDDAPALETTLHETFRDYQVNKVNVRKEFYRVPLDEIEQVVKEKYNATVTFTKVAEAAQYRESLRLSNEKQVAAAVEA